MAGTVVADQLEAASTSTLVLKNGVANTPPTVQDSAGTQIGTFCRAWANYRGVATRVINASFNISSVTYNAAGDYTFYFTNALVDQNYSISGICQQNGGTLQGTGISTSANPTASSCRIVTGYANNGTTYDSTIVCVSIFR